jgi:hypothetical protein
VLLPLELQLLLNLGERGEPTRSALLTSDRAVEGFVHRVVDRRGQPTEVQLDPLVPRPEVQQYAGEPLAALTVKAGWGNSRCAGWA